MRTLRGGRSSTESGPVGHISVWASPPKSRSCTATGSFRHWRLCRVTTCWRRLVPRPFAFQATPPSSAGVHRPSWTTISARGPIRSSSSRAKVRPTGPPPETVTRSTGGPTLGITVVRGSAAGAGATSSRKTSWPIAISSPGRTRWLRTRRPFTAVPLVLPPSWSVQPPPSGRSSAWCREASRVERITWLSAPRPIVSGAVPRSKLCPASSPWIPMSRMMSLSPVFGSAVSTAGTRAAVQ